jgi:hypothetical protein
MSTWQATSRSMLRRIVAERSMALAGATAFLVLVGVLALITDSYDLVLLCILLLQAAIAGYLVTAPAVRTDDSATQAAIDRASARTLTDLAHTRQSLLDAIAEIDSRTP